MGGCGRERKVRGGKKRTRKFASSCCEDELEWDMCEEGGWRDKEANERRKRRRARREEGGRGREKERETRKEEEN